MPRSTDSTTKFKADITDFKASMQEAARYVRLANSEFKEATAGMKNWSSTSDGLSAKIKQLNSILDAQKRQLSTLETEYEKVAREQGENSKGAQELQIRINNQKAAIKSTEAQLDSYADQLNEVTNESQKTEKAAKETSEGFTVMKGVLADLAATAIKQVVSGLKNLATEAFNAGANFESAMSQVAAVSGASSADIERLTAKAKEMGETTKFSASESAAAFNYMAMAGWKTEDMIDGIAGIMNLAAASGTDLATTSDIVTDALTAMGYKAKDAGRLADVMAAASSNANTNVEMMGLTFQYAAPIIGSLGMNMEDAAVAIGLMANAGIKGEKSGTALRSILTRLAAPPAECAQAMEELGISLTDSEGNMKSLDQVMRDLREAFADLSETEKTTNAKHIAGQEAMSGLLAITSATTEDFNKLTDAVAKSAGAAEDMADTMNDNVNGQLTLLKSNIEGKMIKVFEKAAPSIKRSIKQISKALDSINWNKVAKGVENVSKKVADFFTFVVKNSDAVVMSLKVIGTTLGSVFVVSKISTFVKALGTVVPAIAGISTPLTAIIALVGALAAASAILTAKQNEEIEATWGLSEAQQDLADSINENYEAQKQLIDEREKTVQGIAGEYNYIRQLKDEYNNLIDSNGKVKEGYEDRAEFILNELAKALGVEREEIDKQIEANGKLGESIDEVIIKKQAEATLAAYDESYAEAKQNERKAIEDVVAAQNEYVKAQEKTKKAEEERAKTQADLDEKLRRGIISGDIYNLQLRNASKAVDEAKAAEDELKESLDNANQAYIDSQTTIKNYEGLSQAIISGDVDAINQKINELTNGFKGSTNSTRQELEQQVKDYQQYYNDIKAAMEAGNPVITQEMVDGAKELVDKAKVELDKLPPEASATGIKAGEDFASALESGAAATELAGKTVADSGVTGANSVNYKFTNAGNYGGTSYINALESTKGRAKQAGINESNSATAGITNQLAKFSDAGVQGGVNYSSGIDSTQSIARTAGVDEANKAKEGLESVDSTASGENFGEGFGQGIDNKQGSIWQRAWNLGKSALSALAESIKEGSPSKLTRRSGGFFGEGFELGIESWIKKAAKTSAELGIAAYDALDAETKKMNELGSAQGKTFVQGLKDAISVDSKDVLMPLDNMKMQAQAAKSTVNVSGANGVMGTLSGNRTQNVTNNMTQNIYAPKQPSRIEIYRDTRNLLNYIAQPTGGD